MITQGETCAPLLWAARSNCMVQEQSATVTIGKYTIGLGRLLAGVALALIVAFLIIGSLTQPPADPTAIVAPPTNSFILLAALTFVGGMFSFLSPCTLPILPAYFAFAFRSSRATVVANTLAFMLGLAAMFSIFGASASAVGRLVHQQQQLILLVGGGLIILFGFMSLLGQGFGGVQQIAGIERNATLGGSFIFGLTFAIGWSACIGPFLGIVLSLAATTASVLQGMMLLFIYALGLGLPLIVVSALFGRASRDSLVWRVLRGRGQERSVAARTVALIWAFAAWLVLVPLLRFAFPTFDFDATPLLGLTLHLGSVPAGFMLGVYELGLLALLLGGVWLGFRLYGRSAVPTTLHLHSTQPISGVLFIAMGLLLINRQLSIFNSLAGTDLALRLLHIEEQFYNWIALP